MEVIEAPRRSRDDVALPNAATKIRNTVDLIRVWSDLSGEAIETLRQLVRVLRRAGLLPDARIERAPLTDRHISTFLIALLASDTHLGAPEAARRYSALLPDNLADSTPLDGIALGAALVEMLRQSRCGGPLRFYALKISSTHEEATLYIADNANSEIRDRQISFSQIRARDVDQGTRVKATHTIAQIPFVTLALRLEAA